MEDGKLSQQLFGKGLHKPKNRFKDVVKNNLKALTVELEDREQTMGNWSTWLVGCLCFMAYQPL